MSSDTWDLEFKLLLGLNIRVRNSVSVTAASCVRAVAQ